MTFLATIDGKYTSLGDTDRRLECLRIWSCFENYCRTSDLSTKKLNVQSIQQSFFENQDYILDMIRLYWKIMRPGRGEVLLYDMFDVNYIILSYYTVIYFCISSLFHCMMVWMIFIFIMILHQNYYRNDYHVYCIII